MANVLSASLYTAFAEHGVGRPGLLFCHSAIQSRRDAGPNLDATSACCVARVTPKLFWLSDGCWGGEDIEVEDTTAFCDDTLNEDERGAKMMMSVYI